MFWLWAGKRRRQARDWEEELQAHIAIEMDERRQSGMKPSDAESTARQAFGNMTGLQEKLFEHGRWIWRDNLVRDLRHAIRLMRRSPGFSVIVVLTLALGIGASTAIFSLVHAVLLRPLPYKKPDRLAILWSEDRAHNVREQRASLPNLEDWRKLNRSFEDLTFYVGQTFLLGTDGSPERLRSARVPANFFPLLGVQPLTGRVFTAGEEKTGEQVVVLSYGLWQRHFGGALSALGQSLRMDGRLSRVIGVMPAHFQFPFADTQLWEPVTTHPYWARNKTASRTDNPWYVLGRLKTGVGWEHAQTEMDAIANRLLKEHPENEAAPQVSVVPLKIQIAGAFRLSLTVLFCAVFVILLIACINVASLLLARGSVREREFTLRRTLGAGNVRLAAQLFTETLVLSVLGAALGLVVAAAGLKALIAFGPQDIPRLSEARIDGPVLLYATAMALLAAILSGLGPALKTGTSAAKSRACSTVADRNIRNLLVIGEFAMALVLSVGAGLLVHSFVRLQSVDRGFRPDHLLMMRIDLHRAKNARQQAAYFAEAIEQARAIPGVRSAAAVGRLTSYPPQPVAIDGRAGNSPTEMLQAADDLISGPFFETVGVPLKAGRTFSDADGPNAPLVAVINETMARTYWPNENPLGKRFSYPDPNSKTSPPWMTVVGVVGDMHRQGLEKTVAPQVFRPENQTPDNEMDLVVRTASDPGSLAAVVRNTVQSADKSVAKFKVATVEEELGEQGAERRFDTSLIGLFSLVAMFLSGIGIYGLIHHSVVQRSHEIGVRMALGATHGSILSLILRQGLMLSGVGVMAGLLGALGLTKVLSSLLYAVTPTDPVAFTAGAMILLGLAMVACWVPASRAARIDPATVLRQD